MSSLQHHVPPPPARGESKAADFIEMARALEGDSFVADLRVQFGMVETGGMSMPFTVSSGRPGSYLCSPARAYIDYGQEELRIMGASRLTALSLGPLFAFGKHLIRLAGLDRQVQPNNWLLSTNPVPVLSSGTVTRIRQELAGQWPDHALVWRSLDPLTDQSLSSQLRNDGWLLLPNRMVYVFDCKTAPPKVGRNEARDLELLRHSTYSVIDGGAFDRASFERAASLYAQLYLAKYTLLNPHYGPDFMAGMSRAGLIEFKALRAPCGRLDGIIGFFDGGDVMTAPVVGYDTSLPQDTGLYRMLMSLAWSRARARRMTFNISAGADDFKRNRGARPALERMAVYVRHLPLRRRLAAGTLSFLLERVGVPCLRAFVR